MRYLFCDDITKKEEIPAVDVFLSDLAPESMRDDQLKAENKYISAIKRYNLPLVAQLLKWLAYMTAVIICIPLIFNSLRNGFKQVYHVAGWMVWIGVVALIIALCLVIAEKYLEKRMLKNSKVTESLKCMNNANKRTREYLGVPQNTMKCDFLSFTYSEPQGKLKIDGPAVYEDAEIFGKDGALYIYDGIGGVHLIPRSEMKGIRLIHKPVAVLNWNKEESVSDKMFKIRGADPEEGLVYFCILEIEHEGVTFALAFPGYELKKIQKITGFKSPQLPKGTAKGKKIVMDKKAVAALDDDRIKPVFYWRFPKKDFAFWCTPASDYEFKKKHPVLYPLIVIIGMSLFLLPGILFSAYCGTIKVPSNNLWQTVGLFGGFIIGIGLFNIVAAFMNQYLGHFVTILAFVIGGAMIALSYSMVV